MWPIPDRPLPVELLEVLETAAQLELTEFELFRNAFCHWFGTLPGDRDVEPFFVAYMFHQHVPHWVREYIRFLQRETAQGVQWLPLSQSQADLRVHRRTWWPLIGIIAAIASIALLAASHTELLESMQQCYFPPCY